MDTVYIETSIISHASAWPSSDPEIAVLQIQAKRWLAEEAPKYNVVTSQFVIDEATRGDQDAAALAWRCSPISPYCFPMPASNRSPMRSSREH